MSNPDEVLRMIDEMLRYRVNPVLRGPSGEMLIAPDHDSGRPTILPRGMPYPYLEPNEYRQPGYPSEPEPEPKKQPRPPRRNPSPIG